MDTLTHALSGALCARATAPAHVPGRTLPVGRRMLVGTLAAAFPDIDGVTELMSPVAYLAWHRGITHSFLMLPLWTLALAWLCSRLWRDGLGWRAYAGVIALGIGIHIVGDWITSFGTMFLAPLSDRRFALSTTFIIDLVFTGIIVAGLVACLVWRRTRAPAVAGMLALAGYVAFQAVQRERAIDAGVAHARAAGMPQARVDALPRPLSPFHWMVVVEDGDRIEHASVSLVRERAVVAAPDAGLLARLSAAYEPLATARWTRVDRYGAEADAAAGARSARRAGARDLPLVRRPSGAAARRSHRRRDLRVVQGPALLHARARHRAVPLRRLPGRQRTLDRLRTRRRARARAAGRVRLKPDRELAGPVRLDACLWVGCRPGPDGPPRARSGPRPHAGLSPRRLPAARRTRRTFRHAQASAPASRAASSIALNERKP